MLPSMQMKSKTKQKPKKKNVCLEAMYAYRLNTGGGEGYGADLGLEGSLQRAEGSRVWEQRGHAWHGWGVGGEKLGDTK